MDPDRLAASRSLVESAWTDPGRWKEDLAAAEALLSQAVLDDPEDPIARTCLGAVLCDQGRHAEAVDALSVAGRLGSADRNTYFNLGVATRHGTARGRAMALFRQAENLQASPRSWKAWFEPQVH